MKKSATPRRVIIASQPIVLPKDAALTAYRHYHCESDTHTARAKRGDLKKIDEFFSRHKLGYLTDFGADHARAFQLEMFEQGYAPSTVARHYRTLKHIFSHFRNLYPLLPHPCKSVKEPQIEIDQPKSLSVDELTRLRCASSRLSDSVLDTSRARLIIELGARCGLRSAEIRAIEMRHITESSFDGLKTKGRRYRNVPYPRSVGEAMAEYLPHREDMLQRSLLYLCLSAEQKKELPLIIGKISPGKTSFHLGPKTLYDIVRRCGEIAGIENMHPHRLRHTFIAGFLEACGNNLALTRQAAGHANINMTSRYLISEQEKIRRIQEEMQ